MASANDDASRTASRKRKKRSSDEDRTAAPRSEASVITEFPPKGYLGPKRFPEVRRRRSRSTDDAGSGGDVSEVEHLKRILDVTANRTATIRKPLKIATEAAVWTLIADHLQLLRDEIDDTRVLIWERDLTEVD
jgi:hypothetical protein